MIAGSSPLSRAGKRSRAALPLALGALLVFGVACSKDKEPAAKPAQAAPSSSTSSMFQNMQNRPLPKPPVDEGGGSAPPAGAAMPALAPGMADSPECKAFAEEEKAVRGQVDQLNKDVVGPASERAEAAADEYNACQEDAGCVGSLETFKSKQSAYASAKRVEEQAEKQLLELETRLSEIANKMAAKCSDGL